MSSAVSVECRPVRADETDQFLTLLCHVFSLDKERARTVFYSEPFYDLERKWALFVEGEMASILTTTPLRFGWGNAIGIAGVATHPERQTSGHAQRLIEHVLDVAVSRNEAPAVLFAHRSTLYERCGFVELDRVVRGDIRSTGDVVTQPSLDLRDVQTIYNRWSAESDNRLVRDARRWSYWQWVYRTCEPSGRGYVCHEPKLCREAVFPEHETAWPVQPGTEWIGLRSVTRAVGVPLATERDELILMGRGLTRIPELFMTDQF